MKTPIKIRKLSIILVLSRKPRIIKVKILKDISQARLLINIDKSKEKEVISINSIVEE